MKTNGMLYHEHIRWDDTLIHVMVHLNGFLSDEAKMK